MAPRSPRCLGVLVAALLVACITDLNAQWKFSAYPDYLDVLDRLYGTYRVEQPGHSAKLAKMPDGWWLLYEGLDSVTSRHQLWSYQKRKYLKPDLPKLSRGQQHSRMQPFQNTDWTASYYRACPYFGYRGWFEDVIEEYGGKEDLPAFARYGLARAYSGAARSRLDDLQSEAPPGYAYVSDSTDRLSPEEMSDYLDLFQRGCGWLGSVAKMDPGFETHVGEIALKRDHEFMTGYMDLLMAGEAQAARDRVPADAYEPFYRNIAKDYLASCDSNAILFTNGDTDTFPLWYMQVVEGYRRDVLVLNLSLLNAPRFIRAMRNGHLGSLPASWQLPDAFYWSDLSSYVLLGTDRDTLDLAEVIDLLRLTAGTGEQGKAGEFSLSTHYLRLTGPGGARVAWKVPKDYVLRNALAVFDILSQHAAHRPIHWAVTTGPDYYFGLFEHMGLQGFTYKLVFDAPGQVIQGSSAIPEHVLTKRSADLFMKAFEWYPGDTATINKARLVTNCILQASNTAEALAAEGDTARAIALLSQYIALFPNENWPYERIMLRPIELLWDLNVPTMADSIARILVQNLKTLPDVVGPVDIVGTDPDERSIRDAVMDRLHSKAETHQRIEFLAFLDELSPNWPDPLVVKQYWSGSPRPERKRR